MKQLTYSILLALLFTAFQSVAQNSRSQIVVILDGKKYYKHTVVEGETVDGLCKLYNVSLKEMAEVNNSVQAGIRSGEQLKIPFKKAAYTSTVAPRNVKHIVQKKQTLYGISKIYNVSIDDIIKLNPIVKEQNNSVEVGQELTILSDGKHFENPYYIGEDDDFVYVKAEKNLSLDEVSKTFDINTAEILRANPLLKGTVKKGTLIKIPKPEEVYTVVEETIIEDKTVEEKVIVSDPLYFEIPENKVEAIDYMANPFEIRIGVMLPLNISENERIGLNSLNDPKENTFYRNTQHFTTEF